LVRVDLFFFFFFFFRIAIYFQSCQNHHQGFTRECEGELGGLVRVDLFYSVYHFKC
jgi:hypothetical protein